MKNDNRQLEGSKLMDDAQYNSTVCIGRTTLNVPGRHDRKGSLYIGMVKWKNGIAWYRTPVRTSMVANL